MYLIYTDETGTNNNSSITFSMYGGLVVHESMVLKFEMQIIEIVQEFLGFDNMLEVEIHFTEIFNYIFYNRKPDKKHKLDFFDKSIFPILKNKNKDDVIKFIDELFQLIGKIHIPFMFNLIDKRDSFHQKHYLGSEEISHNAYAFKGFLNLIDRFLTKNKEMGLLVADDFSNQIPKKIKNLPIMELISDETIKNNPNVKEIVYKRILSESLIWKNEYLKKSISSNTLAPLKYKFESNSFNIIDNINFISSKESIINQIADILLYVIRKIKEYNLDKQKYQEIKDFCENQSLKSTIDFLYDENIINEVKIFEDDKGFMDISRVGFEKE